MRNGRCAIMKRLLACVVSAIALWAGFDMQAAQAQVQNPAAFVLQETNGGSDINYTSPNRVPTTFSRYDYEYEIIEAQASLILGLGDFDVTDYLDPEDLAGTGSVVGSLQPDGIEVVDEQFTEEIPVVGTINVRVHVWIDELGRGRCQTTGIGDLNSYIDTLTVHVIVTVAGIPYLDTAVIGGNGSLTPVAGYRDLNEIVDLIATPDPGYAVSQWSGTDDDGSTADSNTVTMSQDRSVTVEFVAVPAGKATNPSPANGATGQERNVQLAWTAGAATISHDVYFGTNPTPGAGQFQRNQSATTFDPGLLQYNTTYYWRIDEVNISGTTTGDVWSFTVKPLPAPGQATLPSPADGATGVPPNATLSWTPGTEAVDQFVYFGTNPTPGAGEFVSFQQTSTYDPGPLTAGTTYFWRIDGQNAAGQTEGLVWSFTVAAANFPGPATNPNPLNGANGIPVTGVNLSWTAGLNADSHDVYFGANPVPGAGEFRGNQAGTTFPTGALQYDTTYYWRIDEVNAFGTTNGSVWSFTTEAEPVAPPGVASSPLPADGAVNVNPATNLTWTAGADADSHDVYFGTNPTPGPAEFIGNQGGTVIDPGTLAYDTTYFWRVDEVNAGGTTTGPVWSFTTQIPPPGQVSNPSPADGATSVALGVTLSWTTGSLTDSFRVYFGTSPTPGPAQFKRTQATNLYTPVGLVFGQTYYWRVDAVNAVGQTQGPVWSFTTPILPPPGPATDPTPPDGETDVPPENPILEWTAGEAAQRHNIYLSTTDTLTLDDYVKQQTVTKWNPGVLLPNTTYYWRVDEVNATAVTTGEVWTFTTGDAAPTPAQPLVPANFDTGVAVDVTLRWLPDPNAIQFVVYVSRDLTFGFDQLVGFTDGPELEADFLLPGETYFMRVDSVTAGGVIGTGEIWTFTTAP